MPLLRVRFSGALLKVLSGLKSAFYDSKPERVEFRPEKIDFRPESADFRPTRAWGMDRWMDKHV